MRRAFGAALAVTVMTVTGVGVAVARHDDRPTLTVGGHHYPLQRQAGWADAFVADPTARAVTVMVEGSAYDCSTPHIRPRIVESEHEVRIALDLYADDVVSCAGSMHDPVALLLDLRSPPGTRVLTDERGRRHAVADASRAPRLTVVPEGYRPMPFRWDESAGVTTREYRGAGDSSLIVSGGPPAGTVVPEAQDFVRRAVTVGRYRAEEYEIIGGLLRTYQFRVLRWTTDDGVGLRLSHQTNYRPVPLSTVIAWAKAVR